MPSRRLSVLRRLVLASLAVGVVGTAAAQSSPSAVQADAAMSALSARYTQIWSSLGADERARFSAEERAWLNRGRWDEQKQCMASSATVAAEERAAQCERLVIERRLQRLAPSVQASAKS